MRADLRALTPETLAELTNRGLVKRAGREIERAAPAIVEDGAATVRATFDDGVTTELPVGGLDRGTCSCGAAGVCRHIVGLVLAYQRTADEPRSREAGDGTAAALVAEVDRPVEAGAREWSPGEFTDAQLTERIGERMMTAARRMERTGYIAHVHRARPGDPVSSVELPTATVRFLVPRDLGFARTDAVAGVRDDVLALAVWACREADARFPDESDVQVQVGGGGTAAGGPGLEAAVALASAVLREGAVHIGAGIWADVTTVRRALEAGRLRWPLLAVDDLVAQLDAYRDRSARYRPEALADHVAELFARHRAVTSTDPAELAPADPVELALADPAELALADPAEPAPAGPLEPAPAGSATEVRPRLTSQRALRSRVLGTDEASETPLRRARLDGLGARVSVIGDERVVEIFLAHANSATVLVLRRSYETADTGPQLAARRVAGVSIGSLAGGAVVTESAARSASRAVRLSTRRLSRTEAMTSRGSWQDLPRALLADDLAGLARELDALPPRLVRARVEAELVRVVPVAEVLSVSYAPGAQRLDAVIADAAGVTAVVSAVHATCAPGRLDSMAAALRDDLRYVAGSVRRAGGGIVIDPIGFALDGSVVVPDLAAADRGTDPDDAPAHTTDAVGLALDEAAALLAELAHRGLHHAPSTMPGRLRAAAARLRKVGLRRVGETMMRLAGRLGPDPGDAAAEAWVDAYLRVNLAADMR